MPEISDAELEKEIRSLTANIEQQAPKRQQNGPPTQEGEPIVDIGADNMLRAGELAAQALREVAAECSKRVLSLGAEIMKEAIEKETYCKEFANAMLEHADEQAEESTDFFKRVRTAAVALEDLKRAVMARGVFKKQSPQ